MIIKSTKWGFIRETSDKAKSAGIDRDTGLHRTGLDEYLKAIFPNTNDWIHDKTLGVIDGKTYRTRPDYRSESLRLIVEFDGLQHYTKPDKIESDLKTTEIYHNLGYSVVRIPYFIQLTNQAVHTLFNVVVNEDLFDGNIPSLGIQGQNTPAYLCPAGLRRMASEFRRFPEQYSVNVAFLKSQNDLYKTGVDFLELEYERLQQGNTLR
jgi:hypothetical protein